MMSKLKIFPSADLYKKFLIRMDRVAEFLKVAEVKLDSELLYLSPPRTRYWMFTIAIFAAFIEIWNWQIGDPRSGKGEDGNGVTCCQPIIASSKDMLNTLAHL